MLKMLYILGMCAVVAACIILTLWAAEWHGVDSELEEIRTAPSVVALFREYARSHREGPGERTSPLVVQAQQLASCLNPPLPPVEKRIPNPAAPPSPPRVVPAAPSLQFALQGTSYYPDQPGRSMALVSELGGTEADGRWIKEGDRLGHFVVHEIRKGTVVFRSGDNQRELAIEKRQPARSLVRDVRSGADQAKATRQDQEQAMPPFPAGPNTAALPGGN